MKETGESGSTKNKTVVLLLIILLILIWFVGEILISYHWMKVNRYPVTVRNFLEEFQNTDRYKIMLCHRPDSFVFGDASDYWKIDLVISGHDHGGQVVIPFKGGLYGGDQGWFPPYVHGLYRTGRIRLFVTSGLSSEKQKLPRWNNRPEIAVLNVH